MNPDVIALSQMDVQQRSGMSAFAGPQDG